MGVKAFSGIVTGFCLLEEMRRRNFIELGKRRVRRERFVGRRKIRKYSTV